MVNVKAVYGYEDEKGETAVVKLWEWTHWRSDTSPRTWQRNRLDVHWGY